MHQLILGLHHVTATVDDARQDLDFYTRLLAQRLVKKTVNFDNTGVYHFYYGNEHGTPGTIMTTFPYKGMGVRVGTKGAGQINVTSFSVPPAAIDFWRLRLREQGVAFTEAPTLLNEEALVFDDPSTLRIRLIGAAGDARDPWVPSRDGDITRDVAIRGIHSVTLHVRDTAATVEFLMRMMDMRIAATTPGATRLVAGAGAPGQMVEVVDARADAPAINGLGTVHHVAFAVESAAAQLTMREEIAQAGVRVTEVMDRQYFTSIYFREPGGVLFEIATLPPGFTADEPLASLGSALKLPPWEEHQRDVIAAHLPSVSY